MDDGIIYYDEGDAKPWKIAGTDLEYCTIEEAQAAIARATGQAVQP